MPALGMRARPMRQVPLRLAIGLLALLFLSSLAVASASPAQGANLVGQISANRGSQLYWEGLMRAADHDVKALERAQKQAKRQVKKAKRNLRKARRHRLETRTRARTARQELKAIRAELDALRRSVAESDANASLIPNDTFALLALPTPSAAYYAALVLPGLTVPSLVPSHLTTADGSEIPTLQVAAADSDLARTELAATKLSHAKQKRVHKRLKQRDRKAKRRVSRLARSVRAKSRSVSAMASRRRAAVGRRESAEASLGYRILAMSHPARLRAGKKSDARPGVDSGFTWPARGRMTQSYGCTGLSSNPARGSCRHFHDGIDIAGYRGTWIRAAADGVVSYIGWNPWDNAPRAFMVVVAHAGGYETLYGHVLPTRRVRVGEFVKKGEVIGHMGSTGRSSGVHLHLEIRRGRTTLNPLAFL